MRMKCYWLFTINIGKMLSDTLIVYIDLANLCNFILSDDGFEIKPKYYSLNRFLFLTRVMSLHMYFWNMFYFIYS